MERNNLPWIPLGSKFLRAWLLVVIVCGLLVPAAFCRGADATSVKPVVFVTNYLERGSHLTKPQQTQVTDTVRLLASPGEYEPVTFSIRSDVELKGVNVQLAGDLKSSEGFTIPNTAVEIRLVDPFEQWTKKNLECFLLKKNTADIAPEATRRFWVTIHVPDDAKPGIYRSKILIGRPITALGPDLGRLKTLAALTYEVEVLPIRLLSAQETGMAFFMYNNTAYYARRPDGPQKFVTEAYQKRVFEDMREHGMTTATVYLYPVVNDKFTLTGSTSNYLGFIPTMETMKETKLVTPGLPVIWLGAELYGTDVWKGVLEEGRKRTWPETVFYAVDEPGEEKRNEQVRQFMKRLNAFRSEYPQYDVRVTTALGSSVGIHEVGHLYDLWIGHVLLAMGDVEGQWPQEMGWETDMMSEVERLGKELWVYDCALSPVDAETNRYYFGVWAWVSGVKGCSHWAYFDNKPRLSYVYPSDDELIPTIGWESVREGIDDYRYLSTLKRLADKARASDKNPLAKRADEILDQVKNMVTLSNYSKAYYEAEKKSKVRDDRWYNRRRVEPDLTIEAYDQMRAKVARAIVDIDKTLRSSQ